MSRTVATTSTCCAPPIRTRLCLECHGPDAKPQKAREASTWSTIFNGSVKLPEDYFATVPGSPIKYGRGHPIEKHPVVGPDGPAEPGQS